MIPPAQKIDMAVLESILKTIREEEDWFDSWYGVGPNWEYDLNVYVDDEGQKMATLYPVRNGLTRTSEPILTIVWRDNALHAE